MDTLVASLLAALIVLIFLKNFLFPAGQLPPGPNQLQALTYLPQFIKNPHIALQTLSKIHGPIMSLPMGGQLLVVASSPATAREFCKIHDRALSGRHLPTVYHLIPGTRDSSVVMSPECGPAWKLLRSIAQGCIFSSRMIENNDRIRRTKVAELVGHVGGEVGRVVNVEDLMSATLVNVISRVLTSRDLVELGGKKEDHDGMMELVNRLIERAMTYGVVDYLPALKWVDFWSKNRAKELHAGIKGLWGSIITERRSSGDRNMGSEKDYLGTILEDPAIFSDDQIGNALTELMIGGTDSTAITTVWLMVELLRCPEKLSTVRSELARAVDGSGLSETLLSDCLYFQACIKETLRLHVPAPLLVPHGAVETCQVDGGYVIPKGSMVLVNSWAIARDPESWQDPTSFVPERFLESKIGHLGTHFEYLPFGSGLRTCPGSAVALKNIQMVVGSLLYYFNWSLPDGSDPTGLDLGEKYLTTLKREKELLLVPTLRF